jgi:DNA-directed RNA polymerase subunit L
MPYALIDTFASTTAHDRRLEFRVTKSYPYFVNALRRVLLSEVSCAGIANRYTGAGAKQANQAKNGIHIKKNSGRLHNEFMSHRLSMLPLALDPVGMQQTKFVLSLHKTCPAASLDPIPVMSEDIVLSRIVDGEREAVTDVADLRGCLVAGATQLIPTDPLVERELGKTSSVPRGILLTTLYPDEELHIDIYPTVGRQCDYAGFSPLYTCTYEQLENRKPQRQKDFKFTIESLGAYECTALVRSGLTVLKQKVQLLRQLRHPRTVELDFGSTSPSLHTLLSSTNRTCWVRWSNVDFLTSLGESDNFYKSHCREVLAATTADDIALVPTPYPKDTTVPSIDGEDVHASVDKVKLVLALHQPTFANNGIYEYDASKRQYARIAEPPTAFCIMKEGRTQRALVYTPATILQAHDSRLVLEFPKDVPVAVFEHLTRQIQGVVCAGGAEGEPPVHLAGSKIAREAVQYTCDDNTGYTLVVDEEDHTLGNLVQGYMYDTMLQPGIRPTENTIQLLAVAYNKPLPSEKKIQFRFEFGKPVTRKEFDTFFNLKLDDLEQHLEKVLQMWPSS